MGDLSKNMDIDKLISYSDDLVGVLKDKRDTNSLTQCFDNMKALRSSCDTDFNEVKSLLQGLFLLRFHCLALEKIVEEKTK